MVAVLIIIIMIFLVVAIVVDDDDVGSSGGGSRDMVSGTEKTSTEPIYLCYSLIASIHLSPTQINACV